VGNVNPNPYVTSLTEELEIKRDPSVRFDLIGRPASPRKLRRGPVRMKEEEDNSKGAKERISSSTDCLRKNMLKGGKREIAQV